MLVPPWRMPCSLLLTYMIIKPMRLLLIHLTLKLMMALAYKLPVKEDAKEKGPSSSPADSKTDEIEAEKLCY